MSEKTVFGEDNPDSKTVLSYQGATLMAKGAAYGAVLFFGVLIFIWVLTLVGDLLPPESKEAPDPSLGFVIEAPAETRAA